MHYNESYFPYMVQDDQINSILHREFSQIKQRWGENVHLGIEFLPKADQMQPINFLKDQGIVLGDSSHYTVYAKILCSNETFTNSICVDFEMKLGGLLNF